MQLTTTMFEVKITWQEIIIVNKALIYIQKSRTIKLNIIIVVT